MASQYITTITKDSTTYTVHSGDTFGDIAKRCRDVEMNGYPSGDIWVKGGAVDYLQKFNPDIENVNYISINQKIVLQGTPKKKTVNQVQRPKITHIGKQSGSNNLIFATWAWQHHDRTDHYEVEWRYNTADNISNGFPGEEKQSDEKLSTYSGAPENYTHISVRVKPISKVKKVGTKEQRYFDELWSTMWTTDSTYRKEADPPEKPNPITKEQLTISNKNKLKIKLTGLETLNAKQIQFKIEKDGVDGYAVGTVNIQSNNTATFERTVDPGAFYRASCCAIRDGMTSPWSDLPENDFVPSTPATPGGIYDIYTISELTDQENNQFMVRLHWYTVSGADNYKIQYTDNEHYFDSNSDGVREKTMTDDPKNNPVKVDHTEIAVDGGKTWYFRVRSIKGSTQSDWSAVEAITIGDAPTAPTTWSSTSTAVTGEPLILYWMHNSKDGSRQSSAILELTTTGMVRDDKTGELVYKNETEEIQCGPEEKDKTSSYTIDTSLYEEGVKIKWRVKTAGVLVDDETGEPAYSEWSVHREVNVYAEPTVSLTVTDYKGNSFTELTMLPINVEAHTNLGSQKPIGYYLTITANTDHATVDNIGNKKMITAGSAVYSKYFDKTDNPFITKLDAGDLSLSNNQSYTITCRVSMDSGLTAETSIPFTVMWGDDNEVWPNAEIVYDKDTYTTAIKPYCRVTDENSVETLVEGITLTVYRREFDGTFTEIDTVSNTDEEYVIDPHPSLDYARYRIVAVSETTGAVSYYDTAGYPINEPSVILQWDENWSNFDLSNEDTLKDRYWTGSLLKLMYNIDISDQHDKDTGLIKYIGREHPVSYYGTQIGHTATWNMVIKQDDDETLYALRRLARWMGNVYVREPSGSGYWADVKVSFSKTHNELTIPVTLEITRVEGGK